MNIVKAQWSIEAEKKLQMALDGHADFYKSQIENGNCELYSIEQKNTYIITRIDFVPEKILTICCYAGSDINDVGKFLYECAKKQNCEKIQFHTKRSSLNRLIKWDFLLIDMIDDYMIFELDIK